MSRGNGPAVAALALLLFASAGLAVAAPPAPAARVFFVAGDVAFAAPSAGWPDGALERGRGVEVWRRGASGRVRVAEGVLFRVRAEHVAVTLPEGAGVREGDLVTLAGGGEWQEPAEPASGGPAAMESGVGSELESRLRLMVFGLFRAPALVVADFDSRFHEALVSGRAGGEVVGGRVVADPATAPVILPAVVTGRRQGLPGQAEIRAQAARLRADLVLVPVYVSQDAATGIAGADSVEVRVFDGRTGLPAGVTASSLRPIPSLAWTPSGRRAGRLELVGRWSGVRPAPSGVAVSREGAVTIRIGGDLFALRENEANYVRGEVVTGARRRVSIGTRRAALVAAIEPVPEGEEAAAISGGERVVISRGDEVVFRSGPYGTLTGLAAAGSYLVVMSDDVVELLRFHE